MLNKNGFLKVMSVMVIAAVVAMGQVDITDKFTDPNFKAEVYKAINKTAPAPIYDTDVDTVKELTMKYKHITSFSGIEYFTGLTSLYVPRNQLTTLDVSGCTALTTLDCSDNQLTTLDVSGCTALTTLDCYCNQLTTLDVSGCTALTELDCSDNQLTTLDVSGCTALTTLSCSDNQLTTLDVSKNTALTRLFCHSNYFTGEDKIIGLNKSITKNLFFSPQNSPETLDITAYFTDQNFKTEVYNIIDKAFGEPIYYSDVNTRTTLDVSNKNITSLAGIEYFSELKTLRCNNNQLIALDVSKNTKLTGLWCAYNQLTTFNISKNTELTYLYCNDNVLTALDVSKNVKLKELDVRNNYFTGEDKITGLNKSITTVFCFDPQKAIRVVTFNSNEGFAVADIIVEMGAKVNKPKDPAKTNCTFIGWYKDATLTIPWNFETDVVTANITLYAKWIEVVNVIWGNLTLEWNGEPQSPTVTATLLNGTSMPLTVIEQQTNVGNNYIATATLTTPNDNIQLANTSKTFSITERTVAVKWENTGPFIYNRTVQAPTAKLET
ncbi:MAG: leucine-rich repeat domain-containing protein, partial [Chitinispirillales bacterium]|nr:leucine-rich repeat domain-containing protein [Chitinispirillales bacterium]